MSRDLTAQDIEELVGGGLNTGHYHEERVTHDTLEKLQNIRRIREVATDYTALLSDDILLGNTNSNNVTITLPAVTSNKEYTIVKSAVLNTLTVAFSGGATLFGFSTYDLTNLATSVTFKAYLGNWITVK